MLIRQNRKKSISLVSAALESLIMGLLYYFFLYYLSLGCNQQVRKFNIKLIWGEIEANVKER